jgi:hypothetical protein
VTLTPGVYRTAQIKGLPRIYQLEVEADLADLRKDIERKMNQRFEWLDAPLACSFRAEIGDSM